MDDKKLFAPKGKNITTVNRAFRCISGHALPTSCGVFTNKIDQENPVLYVQRTLFRPIFQGFFVRGRLGS